MDSEDNSGLGPFTQYGVAVAVYRETAPGVSGPRIGMPECVLDFSYRRAATQHERPRSSDPTVPEAFGGEAWELEIEWNWDQRQDEATSIYFLPELDARDKHVVVVRWIDRLRGRWAKRVFWSATVRADAVAPGDGGAYAYSVPLRAAWAGAVTTGTGTPPDLEPTATGEIRLRRADGTRIALYAYDHGAETLTATGSVPDYGVVNGGAVVADEDADWHLAFSPEIPVAEGEGLETPEEELLVFPATAALWTEDAVAMLIPGGELRADGTGGFAGGEDAIEFVSSAGTVLAVVTRSGTIHVADYRESTTRPASTEVTPEAMHFAAPVGGAWQFTLDRHGLVAAGLVEEEEDAA